MAQVSSGTGSRTVLALNGGSSSLKFGLYRRAGAGSIELLDSGETEGAGHDEAMARIETALDGTKPDAIGHRIVHGGPDLFNPVEIDAGVIARLEQASAFAPLHLPASLALIAAVRARYPERPQVACFDTGFHAALPDIAAVLPVPRALRARGVRRYGFHGLSCQSILHQLGADLPGRLIIAHLGSGASVTAVRHGASVDTSMGLTPCGGVVMATRTGDVDPGLLLFLMRDEGLDSAALEELIDRRSGMLGISGLSPDMRQLHAAAGTNADAALAIAIFCRSVAKQIAGMLTSLGGADMIVFTGGIGENDAVVRAVICQDLAWAGVPTSDSARGTIDVTTLPSDEGSQIVRDVFSLIDKQDG